MNISGVTDGTELSVKGKGELPNPECQPGDLMVTIHVPSQRKLLSVDMPSVPQEKTLLSIISSLRPSFVLQYFLWHSQQLKEKVKMLIGISSSDKGKDIKEKEKGSETKQEKEKEKEKEKARGKEEKNQKKENTKDDKIDDFESRARTLAKAHFFKFKVFSHRFHFFSPQRGTFAFWKNVLEANVNHSKTI